MNTRTFISYAREDEKFVIRLATALKERGVPVWIDQLDIPAGADWDQWIDRGLRECGQLLIVLSPAAAESRQVRGELQTALDENKLVVPVLLKQCALPRSLRLIQYVDCTGQYSLDGQKINDVACALRAPPGASSPKPPSEPPQDTTVRRKWYVVGVSVALLLGLVSTVGWIGGRQLIGTDEQRPEIETVANRGSLQVNVNVDGVKVSIDGVAVGVARRTAPVLVSDLAVGRHRVRVEATGYVPEERQVQIAKDGWTQEGFELLPQ